MTRNIVSSGFTIALRLLAITELAISAMVLPRPPSSSPNEISRHAIEENSKYRNDKTHYSLVRLNTNVEKPNTDGYRLLEIELDGDEEVNERNLQGLVRAMLVNEDNSVGYKNEDNYPKPEVIPNSILGVRNLGLSKNYRIDQSMLEPPYENGESSSSRIETGTKENFYSVKSTRPKVDVKVRGKSGSFTDDTIVSTISNDRLSMLRSSIEDEEKIRPPKKQERLRKLKKWKNWKSDWKNDNTSRKIFYGNGNFIARPDRSYDESTTENMSVTSSELPKQIPPPPSRLPNFVFAPQTTPILKYSLRRTDILPGYSYSEA